MTTHRAEAYGDRSRRPRSALKLGIRWPSHGRAVFFRPETASGIADAQERQFGMCNTTKDISEPSPRRNATEAAFTALELVVVIAILCLMAITVIISLTSIA